MLSSPVSGAFKPVEDVGAAGVINLIIRMGVGLLHCHRVTGTTWKDRRGTSDTRSTIPVCECVSTPPPCSPTHPFQFTLVCDPLHCTMHSGICVFSIYKCCVQTEIFVAYRQIKNDLKANLWLPREVFLPQSVQSHFIMLSIAVAVDDCQTDYYHFSFLFKCALSVKMCKK